MLRGFLNYAKVKIQSICLTFLVMQYTKWHSQDSNPEQLVVKHE